MDRREAIAKATTDTTVASDGLLAPEQSRAFLRTIKDKGTLSQKIRLETPTPSSGEINKLSTGARLIRAAVENADDGYRAQPTFPTVPFQTAKIRLPWEVTEDVYHENIAGEALEAQLTDEMTQQFALDLEDLEVNGDTAAGAGPSQAFLQINNGLLKLASTVSGVHRVDGSTINAGAFSKAHLFAGAQAMPNKYLNQGNAVWLMSPARRIDWVEYLTERATGAGDAALVQSGAASNGPLGIEILAVPSFPDDRIMLVNPKNLVRVVSWQIRKRKVTGETDWELATRDKRGYIFFLKHDFIIEEPDAVVDVHTLDPIA